MRVITAKFPSQIMNAFSDDSAKREFVKICLSMGISNDSEFIKITPQQAKKALLSKDPYLVIAGLVDGIPVFGYYNSKANTVSIIPSSIKRTELYAANPLFLAESSENIAEKVKSTLAERKLNKVITDEFGISLDQAKFDDLTVPDGFDKSGYYTGRYTQKPYYDDPINYNLTIRKDRSQEYSASVYKNLERRYNDQISMLQDIIESCTEDISISNDMKDVANKFYLISTSLNNNLSSLLNKVNAYIKSSEYKASNGILDTHNSKAVYAVEMSTHIYDLLTKLKMKLR